MKCPHCSSTDTTWKSKAAKWECNACEERFEGIVCPKCASGDLIWKEKACKWECVSCEERFEPMPVARTPVLAETMPANALSVSPAGLEAASGSTKPKVFLSYGRRDAKDVAERLERDLEAAGYEVWMDVKKIGSGSMWQQEIENGLRKAQVVVSLLSPHAVRRVGESDAMDSVCLDELTFARTSSPPTPVVPVMVVPCEPPFIIYRLDYVHLTGWRDSEEDYRQGFERLVSGIRDALAGKVRYRAWEDRLRPLDFSDYMASKRRGFVGREWLFEEIDLWRFESEERALLITGDPGAGKSSIVAQLVHANPDGQVIGYHCCQSNEIDTLRPAKFVQSLAAMIASRIPAYAHQIEVPSVKEALEDKRCETDPGGAFLEGILHPLQKLPAPDDGVRYILVDALDEALGHTGATNIVDVLASRLERLPAWLRIMATTRNEPAVIQRLSGLRAKSIDASDPRNIKDLATYIGQRLQEPSLAERLVESRMSADAVVESLSLKSLGNFLYAVNALDGISRDFYSFANLDALPRGLDGFYLDFFRRIFGCDGTEAGDRAYKKAKPLLQIMCTAAEPLSRVELADASGLDPDEELPRLLRQLAQLLSRRTRSNGEETIALYHKSVADWLTKNIDFNAFAVSPAKGRKLLAEFCRVALAHGRSKPGWYVRRHAVEHFLEVEDWDNSTAALSDLEFIEARAIAQELPAMLSDYAEALKLLPEGEKERQTEVARQVELDRYALDTAEYAATWSRIRDGSGEAEPSLPRPVESVRLWTEEEIAAERKRMTETPNRLDIVKAFCVFVATNSAPLKKYATQEGFAANLARNDAPVGPVHEEGKRRLEPLKCIKLLKQFGSDEIYNPMPACTAILEGHTSQVRTILVANDGRRIFSAGGNELRFWDIHSGKCVDSIEVGGGGMVFSACLVHQHYIALGSGNEILLWNTATGEQIKNLQGHTGLVVALSAMPSGDLVSMSLDGTIRKWNLISNESSVVINHDRTIDLVVNERCNENAHQVSFDNHRMLIFGMIAFHDVGGLATTSDGQKLVYTLFQKNLSVFDLTSGQNIMLIEGHSDIVTSICISRNGQILISGSRDGTIRIWDLHNGECLKTLSGHSGVVNSISLTDDNNLIISCGSDKKTMVWEVISGTCISSFSHAYDLKSTVFTPDGYQYFCGDFYGAISVLDTRRCLQRIQNHQVNGGGINTLFFSIETKTLISASSDENFFSISLDNKKPLLSFSGHNGPVNSLAYLSHCNRIFSGSDDGTIRVWDMESGECLGIFEGHENPVRSIKLSDDGLFLFSGDGDFNNGKFTLRVWDARTGKCTHNVEGNTGPVYNLAPDFSGRSVFFLSGTSLSGGGMDKIQKWDMQTNEIESFADGHSSTISSFAISPDGKTVFSAGIDGTMLKYDLKSEKTLGSLRAKTAHHILISPDNRLLFCHNHFNLKVLDAFSFSCLNEFSFKGLNCISADWSRKILFCGFLSGRIELFNLENLAFGPLITTARRQIVSEDLPAGPFTARPPCCGQQILLPTSIADRIEYWTYEAGDGEGGYTDSALLLDCPSCSTPLRMNPFFVDIKK